MLIKLYEKTKEWGPGSCMVAFYFISIMLLGVNLSYQVHTNEILNEISRPIGDMNLFISALFIAPWFETILYNVFLTKIFGYMKLRPINSILGVALIFSASHYTQGLLAPFLIFIPAVCFAWNYHLYYEESQTWWGFLSTMVLHFLYNFTLFVVIPMIYMVIDIYYM